MNRLDRNINVAFSNIASIPYRVVTTLTEDGYLVCIPTLGEKLFRAIADTKEEALQLLDSMFPDLFRWLAESGPIPPPTIEDCKISQPLKPRDENSGLSSNIRSTASCCRTNTIKFSLKRELLA